ncbi:hypothetical protein [Dietzia psychralcaliphila]|uniref:Uncharacterized protein n=1 Tax=Dietzia psychralcaliphila TaxID=139021 RepID=A0AAD0JVJ9_9ACTN|nr:hypothetical protein [Dietzia psychralcaliphila]AWH96271.1 hypothetical protein A6048_13030 [Dietzia psychralcaliphila]PTM90646.1 hypothetical protein C8N39_101400 [Dietzia psychralcaliphila]
MFQHRPRSTAPRTRSLALGGALAALAVVGGGTVVAVSAPSEVAAGDILLAQNATGQDATAQDATAQEMELGVPVNLDLEPVVAQAAGGTIPAGTTIQVTGLPDGLAQDGWVISGTPTRAGDYDVLVTVSNGAVSQSEKLTVTVVDASGAAAAATTTTATESGDESGVDGAVDDGAVDDGAVDDEGAATDPAATTTTAQAAPTLSAVPGAPAADAVVPDGTDEDPTGSELDPTGDDGETGTSPDLCAVLGDGEMDGASLTSLLPALTGDDDSASSGLILMLLNAVVGMLPSVLGETGSMQDLGSAGQILCTISPALLGGEPAAGVDTETGGAAALGSAPAELLGMFTTGAGSLGD